MRGKQERQYALLNVVDGITGEVKSLEVQLDKRPRPRLKPTYRSFVLLYQSALSQLANSSLSKSGYRVLLLALAEARYDGLWLATQKAIGERLGLDERSVRSALRELLAAGLLARDREVRSAYILPSWLVRKGRERYDLPEDDVIERVSDHQQLDFPGEEQA